MPLDLKDSPDARIIEELPWEILAVKGAFLAADLGRLFAVARRHGLAKAPEEPEYGDLSLLFMAASPAGVSELDYEGEEAAILAATAPVGTARPSVYLTVDETGSLPGLKQTLTDISGVEALHLSCHGGISPDIGPFLALETASGEREDVTAVKLLYDISHHTPQFVFVSACYTSSSGAEMGEVPAGQRDGQKTRQIVPGLDGMAAADSVAAERDTQGGAAAAGLGTADAFTRQLLVQVPQVLGWDGAVNDREATLFATEFYACLGRGETVPLAAARARARLLTDPPDKESGARLAFGARASQCNRWRASLRAGSVVGATSASRPWKGVPRREGGPN